MLIGVVVDQAVELGVAGGRQVARIDTFTLQRPHHGHRARRRQIPVGAERRLFHDAVVGMRSDEEITVGDLA